MTACLRASESRWTCWKPTNVRAAASASVSVASATTTLESAANEAMTRTTTAVDVASIGIARIATERPDSIAAGRWGRHSASATTVRPSAHSKLSTEPTTNVSDVTRNAYMTSAAQKIASPTASQYQTDPPRRPRTASTPQIAATSSRSATAKDAPTSTSPRSPLSSDRTGLITAASAVAPPAAPSAPSSHSDLVVAPWSRRTRHTTAPRTKT